MTIIPSLWVMALVFVIFLALIVILNRILYKPLLNFMDMRDLSVKRDNEGIESNSLEIKMLKEEAQKVLQNAKAEAIQIRNQAREAAKSKAEKTLNDKRDELKNKYYDYLKSLEEDEKKLRDSLLSQMPLFKEGLKAKINKI